MTQMNEMSETYGMDETNEQLPPIATGLPLDDLDFVAHPDHDIFIALGVDLRGYEPGCDGTDVEEMRLRLFDVRENLFRRALKTLGTRRFVGKLSDSS
jgi:hypothetical protein